MPSQSPSSSAPLEHQHMLSTAISLHRALRATNRSQKFQKSFTAILSPSTQSSLNASTFTNGSKPWGRASPTTMRALRKLATHCQFGATLEEALRDGFVWGLRHDTIKRRLLSETTLTYNKALDIAKGMEAGDQKTKVFRMPERTIKALSDRPPKPSDSPRRYRCSRTNHRPADCKFRDAQCHSCGKTGHIAPVCRSKPLDTRSKKKQDQAR